MTTDSRPFPAFTLPLSASDTELFREFIMQLYREHGRVFSWRKTVDPYAIVVSEIMLQQTQVDRVKHKFEQFMAAFPDFYALAQAQVSDVLYHWQGLGYNRRALAVHALAQRVVEQCGGVLPQTPDELITFRQIGPATAASICAFAFNKPTVFIETNIRAVFIHTFFRNECQEAIKDAHIFPLVEATLDVSNPRTWYYALMDYGVVLKKALMNPSRRSAHYTKQSRFEGSERQIRGAILRHLTEHQALTLTQLCGLINREPDRIARNLAALANEGFLNIQGEHISLR